MLLYNVGGDSGTSFSAPVVAGGVALLAPMHEWELYDKYWEDAEFEVTPLLSSTLRGLAIHGAVDIGSPGPDYRGGWGRFDAAASAEVLLQHIESFREAAAIREGTLLDGAVVELTVPWNGTEPLKVTLAWTDHAYQNGTGADPTGVLPDGVDDSTSMLINDLDLRVIAPDQKAYTPWVLDPSSGSNPSVPGPRAAPATNGQDSGTPTDNWRDNVEQVVVAPGIPAGNPPVAGDYTISISHKGSLQAGNVTGVDQAGEPIFELVGGSQNFSLTISSDIDPPRAEPFAITQIDVDATQLIIMWNALAGHRYAVENSTDLKSWTSLGSEVVASTDSDGLFVTATPSDFFTGGFRFFRVVRLNP